MGISGYLIVIGLVLLVVEGWSISYELRHISLASRKLIKSCDDIGVQLSRFERTLQELDSGMGKVSEQLGPTDNHVGAKSMVAKILERQNEIRAAIDHLGTMMGSHKS